MGHNPNRKAQKWKPAQTAMQWSHHRPIDHECFSHLLTSINWWSSQRERSTPQNIQQTKGVS